nr:SpoIID/LytB domain-containing protein [Rhodothermaceae bacterium]
IENPISQLPANEKLTLTTSSERIYLTSSEGGIYANNLVLAQTDNAELTIEVADGDKRVAPRTFRGAFQIEVEQNPTYKLKIVNAVPLEDYVVSVLSSEFGFNELEGSKALAVCIRTLALKTLTSQNEPNFAVADDESWQVYRGTEAITPTAIRATQETLGQVLVYDDKLIDAVYFASSGGVTANNEDVWNASRSEPYLRGKDDAYDSGSPHNTWTSRIPSSQLLTYLSDLYNVPVAGISLGSVNRRDSRVKSIQLRTQGNSNVTISGSEFREKVNARFGRESLKSTLFTMDQRSGQYVFEGRGYGHGVGLSQWGARELSRRGQLYDEILKFYYTDVEVDYFDMLGRQSFTYANKVETNSVSSDVPRIDWNDPSSVMTDDQTTYTDFDSSDRFSSPSSSSLDFDQELDVSLADSSFSNQSISSRLFDSDEEYTIESGSEPSNAVRGGKKDKKRIYSDRPIVGWSKTVDPQATASSDSVKTRTKRRKGW